MSYLFTNGRPGAPLRAGRFFKHLPRNFGHGKKGREADLFKVPDDMDEPNLTILVAGKEQFPHPEESDS